MADNPIERSPLALSPLSLSRANTRRESQILFGSRSPDGLNNAVVLYDFEQHAVVARRIEAATPSSADRGALVMVHSQPSTPHGPPRGVAASRCPLCNSVLGSPSAPFVSEQYFPTLAFMHKKLATVQDDNPLISTSGGIDEASSALHDISPDLLVNGYYVRFFNETRKIGTGSFGSVFLCSHVIDQVQLGEFAVKKIPVGDSRQWLRGMMREVKALERLATHPNIVSYKHSWLEMNRANELCPYVPYLYILMSYCDSGSLEDLISSPDQNFLPDSTIWSIFLDVSQGLQHLHRNFVLHRDLKASNILLTSDSKSSCGVRAVLTDFGTAELVSEQSRSPRSGFTGTVEYTAPEVFSNHVYSEASDMWSLGIVLYALCYNQVPFSHPDPKVCASFIVESHISLPQTPFRDTALRDMIIALTSTDPTNRPKCDDILFHPAIREKHDERYR
jgi:serine/threonine protein kinase